MQNTNALSLLTGLWRDVAAQKPERILVDSAYVSTPWLHIGLDGPSGVSRRLSALFDNSGIVQEAIISEYTNGCWRPVLSTKDDAVAVYRASHEALVGPLVQ